ncbi:MAG: aminotransferase class III-fold pyridoxal phosphate-dependent enzyme [Gemmatimonadetes bacterium]|nr:aminotransferase class III-fold pyridoxal phosphate-dependent enzyme [Gemmatimonadota bacterium]
MILSGAELPRLVAGIPGPASRALATRLAAHESPNITCQQPAPPIFWVAAKGAAVLDVDGNVYVDLTAGFGVAHAGHANPAVAAAIAAQAPILAHGLGDVFPPEIKVRLLERLAAIAPGDLQVSILANSGAEAVEAALKTAVLRTGRHGVIAFEGGYHGLTFGALAVTHRPHFREPFEAQLFPGVRFVPYPAATEDLDSVLAMVAHELADAETSPWPVGAVLVEPILGRGGLVEPPAAFLPALRGLCDGERTLLICDEVYTGCGRTGRWFACEETDTTPDLLVLGKALSGSLPIAAVIGTPSALSGWPPSTGEAIHTSTFLGNPVACAAALAQLEEIEAGGLLARARDIGDLIASRARRWQERGLIRERSGRGVLQGVRVGSPGAGTVLCAAALRQGVIVLAEGAGDVLALTPPAVITPAQLGPALDVIEGLLPGLPDAGGSDPTSHCASNGADTA